MVSFLYTDTCVDSLTDTWATWKHSHISRHIDTHRHKHIQTDTHIDRQAQTQA